MKKRKTKKKVRVGLGVVLMNRLDLKNQLKKEIKGFGSLNIVV